MDRKLNSEDCRAYGEIISAYLDDELSALELVELGDHLKRCPACSREMDRLMSAKNALHQAEPFWDKAVPGERFIPSLLEQVRQDVGRRIPTRLGWGRHVPPPRRFASLAAVAAVTLLLLLGTVSYFFRPQQSLVASRTSTPPEVFLMARRDDGDSAREYLREHALQSSQNVLIDDDYVAELADHEQP